MKLLSEDLETALSEHGIDVCACGAVLSQCRCRREHARRVVAQSCPSCARTEEVEKGPRDSTFHSKRDIDGLEVKFFYTLDGLGQKNYLFTINDSDPVFSRVSFIFQAEKEAEKAVANILKKRDSRNGQYKHQGGWERMCKCGHTLGQHTDIAIAGKRDCLACEEEDKPNAHHKFVAVKEPKG